MLFREEGGAHVRGHTAVCPRWEVSSGAWGQFSQRRCVWRLELRWPSLSEPQSLYLGDTSILWKDGNSWLGCPAAALGELWGEQVHCTNARSLASATALLSWSRSQGHRAHASMGCRCPGWLVASIYSPRPCPTSFLPACPFSR